MAPGKYTTSDSFISTSGSNVNNLKGRGTISDQFFESYIIVGREAQAAVHTSRRSGALSQEDDADEDKYDPEVRVLKRVNRRRRKRLEVITVLGTIITIVGFFVQIIGIRGSHHFVVRKSCLLEMI